MYYFGTVAALIYFGILFIRHLRYVDNVGLFARRVDRALCVFADFWFAAIYLVVYGEPYPQWWNWFITWIRIRNALWRGTLVRVFY